MCLIPTRQPWGEGKERERKGGVCESVSLGVIVCLLFQDVQVPVCPLCNVPVPVKRGEIPDVVVSEHMDRDCTFHPGRNRGKVRADLGLAQGSALVVPPPLLFRERSIFLLAM